VNSNDSIKGSYKTSGMSVCISNMMIYYLITFFIVTNDLKCHTILSDEKLNDSNVPMLGMLSFSYKTINTYML